MQDGSLLWLWQQHAGCQQAECAMATRCWPGMIKLCVPDAGFGFKGAAIAYSVSNILQAVLLVAAVFLFKVHPFSCQ